MDDLWLEKVKMHTIYDSNLDFCNKNLKIPEKWWREFREKLGNGGRKTLFCSEWMPTSHDLKITSAIYFKHLIDLGFKIYFFEPTGFIDTVHNAIKNVPNIEGKTGSELFRIIVYTKNIYSYDNLLRVFGAKEGDYKIVKEKDFLENNITYFNKKFPESDTYYSYLYSIRMDDLWDLMQSSEYGYFKKYQGSFLRFQYIINEPYYAYILSNQEKIDFIYGMYESWIHRYCLKILYHKVPKNRKDLIPVCFPIALYPSMPSVVKTELEALVYSIYSSCIFSKNIDPNRIKSVVIEKLKKEDVIKIIYMCLKLYEEVRDKKLYALKEVKNKNPKQLMEIAKDKLITIASYGLSELFTQLSTELANFSPYTIKKVRRNLNKLLKEIIYKKHLYEILQVLYQEGLSKESNSFSIKRFELRKKVAELNGISIDDIKESTFTGVIDKLKDFGFIDKKKFFGKDAYIIISDKQKIMDIIHIISKLEELQHNLIGDQQFREKFATDPMTIIKEYGLDIFEEDIPYSIEVLGRAIGF